MMKRYLCLVSLGLLALNGCSSSIPLTHYYTFQPQSFTSQKTTTARSPHILAIDSFSADVPYQQERLVFRTSPYEVNFYEYRKWLRPPTDLVTEQVFHALKMSGMFEEVRVYDAGADYLLQGRIVMFEQWYEDQLASTVHVGVRYALVTPDEERVIWTETIATSARTPSLEILETIQAFETALQQNIQQAIASIGQTFQHEQ